MLTAKRACELLSYNHETGVITRKSNKQRSDLVGLPAGHVDNSTGVWRINIDGSRYPYASVAWLLYYGEYPDTPIDHIDLNKGNHKISNLRLSTKSQNAANAKLNARSSTGVKGVSYCSATGLWRASIQVAGRSLNLGRYATVIAASNAYATAATKYFGEFARV